VGAQLKLHGKPISLLQGTLDTNTWIAQHAERLRTLKRGVQEEVVKYHPGARIAMPTMNEGTSGAGGTNLRSLVVQIELHAAALEKFRPSRGAGRASHTPVAAPLFFTLAFSAVLWPWTWGLQGVDVNIA
jgi:hypothetical protein